MVVAKSLCVPKETYDVTRCLGLLGLSGVFSFDSAFVFTTSAALGLDVFGVLFKTLAFFVPLGVHPIVTPLSPCLVAVLSGFFFTSSAVRAMVMMILFKAQKA